MNKTISILGCGWLGVALAKRLRGRSLQIKGSTTDPIKLPRLRDIGIIPFLLNFDPELNVQNQEMQIAWKNFIQTNLLIIAIPPKVKSKGESYHLRQVESLIANLSSLSPAILYISSTSVYGEHQGVVDESTDPCPTKASGKTLVAAEKKLRGAFPNKLTILRLGGLVGPERSASNFSERKRELLSSNQPINLIHQRDALGIIETIMERDIWGEVFNGVADGHISKKIFYQRQKKISETTIVETTTEVTAIAEEDCALNGKIVLNKKIKELLNYQFVHSFL